MAISRRKFLKNVGLASTAMPLSSLAGCVDPVDNSQEPSFFEYTYNGPLGPEETFEHGVASGDPARSSVVLWTRVTSNAEDDVEVFWQIAHDDKFENLVATGLFKTGVKRDFTVKVLPTSLRPGRRYYYRFQALGRTSPTGVTRTTAQEGLDRVVFGVCSCSNYRRGYFHTYRNMAKRDDLDAVLHLGDYFYESGGTGEVEGRDHVPTWELLTLSDYRLRFSLHRRDPDLQELHRKVPWITIWDDHESANDSYFDGAGAHGLDDGDWFERKEASIRAYFEWMPIREFEPGRIWRSIYFGDLIELNMLDTRLWGREEQPSNPPALDDPRQILGADQEAWLFEQLTESNSKWRVLGQQVMMAQLKAVGRPNDMGGGAFVNFDQWDGYRGARKRLYDVITANDINNVVVLTGDIHSSWASELTQDPNNPDAYDPTTGKGAVGVEFVTPAVTSPGIALGQNIMDTISKASPHIKYIDPLSRGYIILEVTPEYAQADFHHIDDITDPNSKEKIAASFRVKSGSHHLESMDTSIDD